MQNTTKTQDALNRAVRTIIQFIVVDVLIVVIPEVTKALDDGSDADWSRIGSMAARVALGGILAYVMRLKVPPQETPPPVPAPGGE